MEAAQQTYSKQLALVGKGNNMEGKKVVDAEFSPGTRVPSSDSRNHMESYPCDP